MKTWPGETWKTGGGPVWGWLSYDPELRLVYYGTGNPGPGNPEQRRGDNQFTSGVLPATSIPARRAGITRARRTICSTMTTSTRSSSSTCRRGAAGESRR